MSLSMASFRSWDPGSRLKSMLEVCSVCDSKTVPWTFCENEKNIFSDFSISTLASLDISTFSSFFKYPFWGAAVLSGSGKGRNSHPGYQWRNIYLRGAAPLRGGLATCSWVVKPQRGSTCSGAHSAEGRHLAGAGLAQGGPRPVCLRRLPSHVSCRESERLVRGLPREQRLRHAGRWTHPLPFCTILPGLQNRRGAERHFVETIGGDRCEWGKAEFETG